MMNLAVILWSLIKLKGTEILIMYYLFILYGEHSYCKWPFQTFLRAYLFDYCLREYRR